MEKVTIEFLLKKINDLEKKLEWYFNFLKIENELDFIIKGTYVLNEDLTNLINGQY